MTHEDFLALVHRNEQRAQQNPRRYRNQVVLLALLGYGYLGVVVALLLGALGLAVASVVYLKAVAFKLIVPLAGLLWIVLRSLWVPVAPPKGRRITRSDAPALFERLEGLRQRVGAAPLHQVQVTGDFNAGVTQVPRLGVFGWHRNYLLLGLPLMKALTVEQFDAVLAHEFAHLARGHARLANWVYRSRESWTRLMTALGQRGRGNWLFARFFQWYAPFFGASSFPLARANEYEADQVAARLTSPACQAEALSGVQVMERHLDREFWPSLLAQAATVPIPPAVAYSAMGLPAAVAKNGESMEQWLQEALDEVTSVDDTHPSYADRLKAIGQEPRLALPSAGEGADRLLEPARGAIVEELDLQWRTLVWPQWEAHYTDCSERRARLAELDRRAGLESELPLDDAYTRAVLTASVGAGAEAAFEQFRCLFERAPGEPWVRFQWGTLLLQRDDEAGVALVEGVLEASDELFVSACETLRDDCWRKGHPQQAYEWQLRLNQGREAAEASQKERERLLSTDRFQPHGLEAAEIEALRVQLHRIPGLRKAYFARRDLRYPTKQPAFVLGHVVTPWWHLQQKAHVAAVQKALIEQVTYPGETLIVNLEAGNRTFGYKLARIQGSRIL